MYDNQPFTKKPLKQCVPFKGWVIHRKLKASFGDANSTLTFSSGYSGLLKGKDDLLAT